MLVENIDREEFVDIGFLVVDRGEIEVRGGKRRCLFYFVVEEVGI